MPRGCTVVLLYNKEQQFPFDIQVLFSDVQILLDNASGGKNTSRVNIVVVICKLSGTASLREQLRRSHHGKCIRSRWIQTLEFQWLLCYSAC